MDERKRSSNESPLSELVDRWLRAYGLDKKMKEVELINGWEELMGKAVAQRTEHIEIRDKKLYLTIKSSVLREELQQEKQALIKKVNVFAGFEMIKDIWFA